jgi:hypothetical protein
MNSSFWQRFPTALEIRCIDMKDHAQVQVAQATRGASPEKLVAYFQEASRRFWKEMGYPCSDSAMAPMVVRESTAPNTEG